MTLKNSCLFLALFFLLNTPLLLGLNQIIQEYPELSDFLHSSEFKILTLGIPITIAYTDPKSSNLIASYSVEINGLGAVSKKIVFNSFYVNRNIASAEEFKFILCHELGHLNDKNLYKNQLILLGIHLLLNAGTLLLTANNLTHKKWLSAIKNFGVGATASCLTYLLILKLSRNREFFADEFAINITKNKEAAESALHKRKKWQAKSRWISDFLKNVLNDHPNEDLRIANIRACSGCL